jgi:hypothetical protein
VSDDGVPDTGVLAAGETRNLILRVTPSVGVTGPDTTEVRGISYLDQRIDTVNNTTRTATGTTRTWRTISIHRSNSSIPASSASGCSC